MHNVELCIHIVLSCDSGHTKTSSQGGRTIADSQRAETGLIDVHTHAIDADLPDLGQLHPEDRWPSVQRTGEFDALLTFGGEAYRRIDHRCWSTADRLADMDREGVAIQVVSPIPVTFCYQAEASPAAELASLQNVHALRWLEPSECGSKNPPMGDEPNRRPRLR